MKVLVGLPLKTKEIVKVVKVLLNLKEIIFKVVSSRGVGKTFTTFTTFTFENCPFSFLGNTAPETLALQIPGNVRLEHSQPGPTMEPVCPAQRNCRGS